MHTRADPVAGLRYDARDPTCCSGSMPTWTRSWPATGGPLQLPGRGRSRLARRV